MKRALITGITGQDGSYLAELLLAEGYEVGGIVRRVAAQDEDRRTWRIRHILPQVKLFSASLESFPSLCRVVYDFQPDECYHLAAQSYVGYAFEDEFSTINTNLAGTHFMLGAIRDWSPGCRFYFAGTSEMFGNAQLSPQNEDTPFAPRSSYGVSKLAGFHLARLYREAHGMYTASGILFNHESPRRGSEFVTRKITQGVAKIKLGLQDQLKLGNLDARRDWGYAGDYVQAMHRMLRQDEPADYVIATGQTHSVREFVETAFGVVGLDAYDYVETDKALLRPSEVYDLRGDATRAETELGWKPRTAFNGLVEMMVEADMLELK